MSVFAGQPPLSGIDVPLVSIDDFAEWFGVTLSSGDEARASTALEISSAAVRNGRRIFTAVTGETVLVNGTGAGSFLLPKERLPVRDIVSITETRLDGSTQLVDAGSYSWDADGIVELTGRGHWCWTQRRQGLSVVYSHGYLTLPREVAGIVLAYAKRIYDDPANSKVVREQLGDYQVEYEPGGGLLPDELVRLELYEAGR